MPAKHWQKYKSNCFNTKVAWYQTELWWRKASSFLCVYEIIFFLLARVVGDLHALLTKDQIGECSLWTLFSSLFWLNDLQLPCWTSLSPLSSGSFQAQAIHKDFFFFSFRLLFSYLKATLSPRLYCTASKSFLHRVTFKNVSKQTNSSSHRQRRPEPDPTGASEKSSFYMDTVDRWAQLPADSMEQIYRSCVWGCLVQFSLEASHPGTEIEQSPTSPNRK